MPEVFAHVFAINGTWLFGPDNYQEEPVPVAGYNQKGEPIRQGYPTFTFIWSFLNQANFTALNALYNGNVPAVIVTYIAKETGLPAQFRGMMHEPIVGQRNIVYYNNVGVKFTHCEPQ